MSSLLQLVGGFKSFGTRQLFDGATFSIDDDEHVGVIGPNGAGKTTLFKILTGEDFLDKGEIVKRRGLRIGYLKQHDDWKPGTTVEDYLQSGTTLPLWELKSLARGLGLEEKHFDISLDSLSGGYRTRAKLLYLIGCEPDILMLDEPTNYLDLESTLVLESFLQSTKSAFLLISHDREFLRRTTDHILEVEGGEITKYNGSLDDYFEQKELLRSQLEARAMSQSQKRQQILDFVARFGAKASKARQAQSRLKQLGRMETIDFKPLAQGAKIHIPPPKHCGKSVFTVRNAKLGYGDKTILSEVNLAVQRGDHIAVVGVNGAGKSTLLKALAQKIKPLEGEIEFGMDVTLGYYAQHVAEGLYPQETVIEALTRVSNPDISRQEILNMAGSLLFSGDDSKKKVQVLSGGEKSRVALGQILLQKSPLIVLDEPTNHLDFQTVEALTGALDAYEGTVVVVSHDRSFVRRVGRKILEINNGKVFLYPGSYDEYVWSQQKGVLKSETPKKETQEQKAKIPLENPNGKLSPQALKEKSKEISRIEKELKRIDLSFETKNKELNELLLLSSEQQRGQSHRVQELLILISQDQEKKESLENQWLKLNEN